MHIYEKIASKWRNFMTEINKNGGSEETNEIKVDIF